MMWPERFRQRGVGLVEVMVGLFVGMIVTLVIYQMFSGYEVQRRTTVGAASAQQAGALAMFLLNRDLRMAGWGSAAPNGLACTDAYTYDVDSGAPVPGLALMPVVIDDGGTGLSDRISITTGDSVRASAESRLLSDMSNPLSDLLVLSTLGFNAGDLIWVGQGTECTLMQITGIDAAGLLRHQADPVSSFNPDLAQAQSARWPSYQQGARIFNMGRLERLSFEVADGGLRLIRVRGSAPASTQIVTDDVVNLQAQYGLSATRAARDVNQWLDGSAISPADIERIKALRLAVVTRSARMERPDANTGACTTTTVAPISWTGGPTIDLSGDADWMCYRYRVFQNIIPLTNVLWATS